MTEPKMVQWIAYNPDGTTREFEAPPGPPHVVDSDGQAWASGPDGLIPFDYRKWMAGA